MDLDQRRRISFIGGRGLRRRWGAIACSGGVCIDGVSRLGVISKGVKRCDKRDSKAGDEFSTDPAVWYVSSLTSDVRNELSLVVVKVGLLYEQEDSERDLSVGPFSI